MVAWYYDGFAVKILVLQALIVLDVGEGGREECDSSVYVGM